MGDRKYDDASKLETKVRVVPSRYALALQKKNRKLNLKSFGTTANRTSPAAPMALKPRRRMLQHEKELRSASSRKEKTVRSTLPSALQSMPRPPFPTRISSPSAKQNNRVVDRLRQNGAAVSESEEVNRRESACTEHTEPAEHGTVTVGNSSQASQSTKLNDADELELLQSVYYQLCFVEAKAEDTFRRQEHRAQAQMITAWEILQSKLHKLQQTSLALDRQEHTEMIETHFENLAAPTAQLAERLPRALDSISQMCTSAEIALNRLACPGISCTNPLQLKQQMEALTVELDSLLEQIQTTHIGDTISSIISFDHDVQRIADKSTEALLQVAHLVSKLGLEVKASGGELANKETQY